MFLDKYKPIYAPEVEGAGAVEDQGGAPPAPTEGVTEEGPGSGRSSIRKELEKGFAADRTTGETQERKPKQQKSRVRQAEAPEEAEQETLPEIEAGAPDQQAAPATPAPTAWSKEARAEWGKLPPTVQQAVAKREVDVARGVQELRQGYADIDQIIKPRSEVFKQFGQTPAQAINQLFMWMDALGQDKNRIKAGQPPAAFQALAHSFGIDPKFISGQPVQQQEPADQQPEGEVPPAVQKYITSLESKLEQFAQAVNQQFGSLNGTFQKQNMDRTEEYLAAWSKDKEHFEDVRHLMAQLIQSGAVPPTEAGQADLDRAYDMAVYASPNVRSKIFNAKAAADAKAQKDKAEAERKLQREQADKARRASGGSLSLGPPGVPVKPGDRFKPKGKSVRESLNEAIEEHTS